VAEKQRHREACEQRPQPAPLADERLGRVLKAQVVVDEALDLALGIGQIVMCV